MALGGQQPGDKIPDNDRNLRKICGRKLQNPKFDLGTKINREYAEKTR